MKKVISSILALGLAFSLVGCSNTSSEVETQGQDVKEVSAFSILQNNNSNYFIAENESDIYYSYFNSIKKLSKEDNSISDVFTFEGDEYIPITTIEYFNNRLYILMADELVSMDTNGENILRLNKADVEDTGMDFSSAQMYVFNDNIYVYMSMESIYMINGETLSLEKSNENIFNKIQVSETETIVLSAEDVNGEIYLEKEDKTKTLISSEDEKVLLYQVGVSDEFVFYPVYNNTDFEKAANSTTGIIVSLYKIDFNGENKEVIIEFDITSEYQNIKYDAEYIYLIGYKNEVLKINKDTLEESLITIDETIMGIYDISSEKIFSIFGEPFYIDTITGEKVNLS